MAEPKRIYVHAFSALGPLGAASAAERRAVTADPDTDLRPIAKRVLGQGLRQASHFVELAAIGARLCLERLGRMPPPDTAIYMGTALGEIRRTEALFRQVLPPGPGFAAPFDFINATANMAAFYVARIAGLSARNLTVTQGVMSFEAALRLALDDLRHGAVPAALVGGVDENYFPRAEYLRRYPLRDDEVMGEGSAWLYLDSDPQQALAELLWVRRMEAAADESDAWVQAVAQALDDADEPIALLPGIGVTANERAALAQRLPRAQLRSYLEFCGNYPTAAAFGIATWLEAGVHGLCVHVNRVGNGETMLAGLGAAAR
jgi:hypothetical protein